MARIVVTRPVEQAESLAERLRTAGHTVLVEPMLQVRFLDTPLPSLDGVQAVLVTSRNGVRALVKATERRDLRLLAVGDATAAEARAAGFSAVESADGDADDLIEHAVRILKPDAGRLVHISGFDVAIDIAAALAAKGFQAERVVLYEADVASELTGPLRSALADRAIDVVLFHSPRAAKTFATLVEDAGLAGKLGTVTALALSEQVAGAIRHLGWQAVQVAQRPNETALLDRLEIATPPLGPMPNLGPTEPPLSAAPRQRAAAPVLLGALLLGLVGGAGGAWLLDRYMPSAGAPDRAAVEGRMAALERRISAVEGVAKTALPDIDALSGRITVLEQAPAVPAPPPASDTDGNARLDQLADRVAALEARSAEPAPAPPAPAPSAPAVAPPAGDADLVPQVAALDQAVKGLADRVAALGQQPRLPADLGDRMASVERQAKAIDERLAAAAPRSGEAARFALVLAANELAELVLAGRPYGEALANVNALLGAEKALTEPLAAQSATGVPTLQRLRERFPAVARDVVEAEAAGNGDGWWDHVRGRLAAIFVLRRTGEVGGDAADAVVARAEARLQAGDLAAAEAELGRLTGRPAEAAAAWRQQAGLRLQAEKVVAALKRRTIEIARAALQ